MFPKVRVKLSPTLLTGRSNLPEVWNLREVRRFITELRERPVLMVNTPGVLRTAGEFTGSLTRTYGMDH